MDKDASMAPENIIQTGRKCFNFGVQYVLIFSERWGLKERLLGRAVQ